MNMGARPCRQQLDSGPSDCMLAISAGNAVCVTAVINGAQGPDLTPYITESMCRAQLGLVHQKAARLRP